MRKLPLVPALLALLLSVVLLPPSAQAYDEPYVIAVRPDASRVAIASSSCRNIAYSVWIGGGSDLSDLDASGTIDVWRGTRNVGSDFAFDDVVGGRIRSTYLWCPYTDGLGNFRFDFVEGSWSGVTPCEHYDHEYGYCEVGEDYVDGTLVGGSDGRTTVKQAARVNQLRSQRSGAVRSVSAKAIFYSIGQSRWAWVPRGRAVVLQRRAVGGTTWTRVKTLSVSRRGVISTRWSASRVSDYRLVTGSTASTWNGVSAVFRR